jgi:hypothetical protein
MRRRWPPPWPTPSATLPGLCNATKQPGLPATAAVVRSNRQFGPERVLQMVEERIRGPEDDIASVVTRQELDKLRSDGDWRDNAAEAVASDPCSNHEPASARPPARGRCISAAWISRRARFDRNEECRPSIDSKDALKFNASIGVRSRIQTRLARAARPTIGDDHARSAFTAPEQKIRLLRAIDKSAPSRSAILDLAARR